MTTGWPGLSFVEKEGRVLVHRQAPASHPPLDAAKLHELLKQAGYGQWFVHEEALATAVARCNAGDETFDVPVGERRDGSFMVEIAPDALCAWVTLVPAYGGKAIATEDVLRGLQSANVKFGIDQHAIGDLCRANQPGRVVAALGVPPTHGEDARFDLLIDLHRSRTPKLNAQGLIDFRDLGEIMVVEAESPLMRRTPATAGVNGRNVHDQVVPAKPGQDSKFTDNLAGVHLAADDPNVLVSAVKGQPVQVENGVQVEQVLRLKEVNLSSGNITFDGSVVIEGDVTNGMKVHATGDIQVGGTVDGGILDSGGSIQISGGVIAGARVQAAGAVSARFVEHAYLNAGTVISVDDMVLQSELQALNQILVGVKSPQRGRLVGGMARAMLLVQAPILGGVASTNTQVQVGVNPVLEARHRELEELSEKQKKDEENLKKLVHHLIKTGGNKDVLEKAKTSWKHTVQIWAETLKEKDEVEKQLALIDGARVEVRQSTAGAVDLAFGKRVRPLHHEYDAGTFTVSGDKLLFTSASGKVMHAD